MVKICHLLVEISATHAALWEKKTLSFFKCVKNELLDVTRRRCSLDLHNFIPKLHSNVLLCVCFYSTGRGR